MEAFRSLFSKARIISQKGEFWLTVLEIAIVLGWAYYFTTPLFNLNPESYPNGREFTWGIESNYFWKHLFECGSCVFWNGNFQGGHPTFADPLTSFMHPLVAVTTLIWGVVNGAKIALVGAFFLAGISQWLLGWVLGMGRLSRVWAALIAVVGGHLASRMELGAFGVIISTATFPLVLALFFWMYKKSNYRRIVLFGLGLASLAVGGQGYIQVGTALMLLLAVLSLKIFYWQEDHQSFQRSFITGTLLALMLAAPLLISFIHFLPNFGKTIDTNFNSAQPIGLASLNLVINDYSFYQTSALGKPALPGNYIIFIGWIPIILAFIGLNQPFRSLRGKQVILLSVLVLSALWIGSAGLLRLLVWVSPFGWLDQLLLGLRFPSFILSLAVPPLLALSGFGLDRLLSKIPHQIQVSLNQENQENKTFQIPLAWILIPVLVLAIRNVHDFTARFIFINPPNPQIGDVIPNLETLDSQWVNVPFGEQFWIQGALDKGMKLGFDFTRTWTWPDQPPPTVYLEANYGESPEGMQKIADVGNVHIQKAISGPNYARVTLQDGQTIACVSRSVWGNIDVRCNTPNEGVLVVQENYWTGWRAWVNGETSSFIPSQWLVVSVPAGQSRIQFRYLPWDAPLGLIILLLGAGISIYLWRHKEPGEMAIPVDNHGDADSGTP